MSYVNWPYAANFFKNGLIWMTLLIHVCKCIWVFRIILRYSKSKMAAMRWLFKICLIRMKFGRHVLEDVHFNNIFTFIKISLWSIWQPFWLFVKGYLDHFSVTVGDRNTRLLLSTAILINKLWYLSSLEIITIFVCFVF